jgi:hypothetical protein
VPFKNLKEVLGKEDASVLLRGWPYLAAVAGIAW